MKRLTWHLLTVVTGALLAVSGVALGQGSMRDTTEIPGDARNQGSTQGGIQDTTQRGSYDTTRGSAKDSIQGGPVDTMFDRSRSGSGSVIDSTQRGIGKTTDSTRDSVQGSTSGSMAPDNTGINKRDRNNNEMTADEQGQSAGDIDMTRKIRQAIVEDDSLSTYAKNVKIITKDGMVTLKGPVRSEQEKSTIEAKAAAIAGTAKIRNEIEVKAATRQRND